jgi:hypothetical protein
MFGKIFGKIIDPQNPRALRGDLEIVLEDLSILTEVLFKAKKYYGYHKMTEILDERDILASRFSTRNNKRINKLIYDVFGLGSYKDLVLKMIDREIKYNGKNQDSNYPIFQATPQNLILDSRLPPNTFIPPQIKLEFG